MTGLWELSGQAAALAVRASWQAAILALVVFVVCLCFRRMPARWQCMLWMLVLGRLLMPIVPASSASAFNLPTPWTSSSEADEPALLQPTPQEVNCTVTLAPIDDTPSNASAVQPLEIEASQSSGGVAIEWPDVLLALWLAGIGVMLLREIVQHVRLHRVLARSETATDDALLRLLDACRREMGVRRRVRLLLTREAVGPAVTGVLRSTIVMPQAMAESLNDDELRWLLCHELSHVKRHDVAINAAWRLARAIHWFNPLVHWGLLSARRNAESACDERVLARSGEAAPIEYGRALLRVAELLSEWKPIPVAIGLFTREPNLKRRITMIADYRRPSRRWTFIACTLLCVLAVTGLTDAVEEEKEPPDKVGQEAAMKPMAEEVLPPLSVQGYDSGIITVRESDVPATRALMHVVVHPAATALALKEFLDEQEEEWGFSIHYFELTNTLILRGPAEGPWDEVTERIATIDEEFGPPTKIKCVYCQFTTVNEVADALNEFLEQQDDDWGFTVEPFEGNNSLVVRGPIDGRWEEVQDRIAELDEEIARQDRVVRVLHPAHMDAEELLKQLNEHRGQLNKHRGDEKTLWEGTVNKTSGSLVLSGPRFELARVESLALQLDKESSDDAVKAEIYELKHARAEDVIQSIIAMLQKKDQKWKAMADVRANTIIVTGSGKDREMVRSHIEILDSPVPLVLITTRVLEAPARKLEASLLERLIDKKNDTETVEPEQEGTVQFEILQEPSAEEILETATKDHGAKVISRPTLVTPDGSAAFFMVGTEVPVQTPDSKKGFRTVGLEMGFEPDIQEDGRIRLDLHVNHTRHLKKDHFAVQQVKTTVECQEGQTLITSLPGDFDVEELLVIMTVERFGEQEGK